MSVICLSAITFTFNNCAPVHEQSGSLPSIVDPDSPDSIDIFTNTAHIAFRANCIPCHENAPRVRLGSIDP